EHRSRSCDDSTRRCDSQAGWDFRKGHGATSSRSSAARRRGQHWRADKRPDVFIVSAACLRARAMLRIMFRCSVNCGGSASSKVKPSPQRSIKILVRHQPLLGASPFSVFGDHGGGGQRKSKDQPHAKRVYALIFTRHHPFLASAFIAQSKPEI